MIAPTPPSSSAGALDPGVCARDGGGEWIDDLLERCAFPPPGTPMTCAVSGGPDSTALLALAVAAGCRATAVHVDHGLRQGSADEATVVAATAARLGAAFEARRAEVEDGPDLEARARAARFAVLPPDVATGHTADDRAETLLLNLVRGAGLGGLAAMAPGPRHPILRLRRADTEAVCGRLGLSVVRDPSNTQRRHRRNRIRHEVLPLLADVADRDVVPLLVRTAELAAADVELLETLAAAVDPTDVASLRASPPALARRALRRWLTPVLDGYPPDAAAVDRVLAVAAGRRRATEVATGSGAVVSVRRSRGCLAITRSEPPVPPASPAAPG